MIVATRGGGDEFFRRGEVRLPDRWRLERFVPYLPNLGGASLGDVELDHHQDRAAGLASEQHGFDPTDQFSRN